MKKLMNQPKPMLLVSGLFLSLLFAGFATQSFAVSPEKELVREVLQSVQANLIELQESLRRGEFEAKVGCALLSENKGRLDLLMSHLRDHDALTDSLTQIKNSNQFLTLECLTKQDLLNYFVWKNEITNTLAKTERLLNQL